MPPLSVLSMPHIVDAVDLVQRNFTVDNITWDNAKNLVIFYLVWTRSIKAYRHIRARGLISTVEDAYKWIAQRVMRVVIRSPWLKDRVELEMGQAKASIQRSLIPQGPDVVRHLALPMSSRSLDDILADMEKMDTDGPSHTDYKEGKLSGAVYHEKNSCLVPSIDALRTRRSVPSPISDLSS
ncbi:hypothetical protein OF83DRAFT_1102559, partial [Amylostereum chailletii]